MQRMNSVPILCIGVNVTIDTMLNFDANADAMLALALSVNGPLMILEQFISILMDYLHKYLDLHESTPHLDLFVCRALYSLEVSGCDDLQDSAVLG